MNDLWISYSIYKTKTFFIISKNREKRGEEEVTVRNVVQRCTVQHQFK